MPAFAYAFSDAFDVLELALDAVDLHRWFGRGRMPPKPLGRRDSGTPRIAALSLVESVVQSYFVALNDRECLALSSDCRANVISDNRIDWLNAVSSSLQVAHM